MRLLLRAEGVKRNRRPSWLLGTATGVDLIGREIVSDHTLLEIPEGRQADYRSASLASLTKAFATAEYSTCVAMTSPLLPPLFRRPAELAAAFQRAPRSEPWRFVDAKFRLYVRKSATRADHPAPK